jgi:lipopolysaccharide export system ATP-binding protein
MSKVTLFSVENLCKSFKGKQVVSDVGYSVDRGELVGLLGTNGAGKTTSFRMAVGLLHPDSGRVFLEEEDITRDPIHIRARKGMGYLSQEPSVFQGMSVRDNLIAILEMRRVPRQERIERTDQMLEEFGLKDHRDKYARNLSGGLRRRLEIGRTLLLRPKLLLLDEPFSGLDPKVVGDIQELIRGLTKREIGILLTDHNVRETLAVTDRAYIMHEGKIVRHGHPEELVKDEFVREVYLGDRFDRSFAEHRDYFERRSEDIAPNP